MISLGVIVAVFSEGRMLLTQREDFAVWCLPGGGVDEGEALAEAAVREVREETGLEVELTELVGVYSEQGMRGMRLHMICFAARPVGGTLCPDPAEVLAADYFAQTELPNPLVYHHHAAIADAFAGVGGSAIRSVPLTFPQPRWNSRQELYAARDASGLTRQEFYLQQLARLTIDD
ncbi:MAG: NUDIX domain-containing protein [Chloroflexaceae bacterium]|jgi:ADP-ribose pyrophosphatase YjhB (NUDIX family)|nr:NUDIX domain-containing protein [Chloroflexaceae bacterium]